MIKKILTAVVILGIIGASIGYKMYNKPHTDISSEKSIANITADQLLAAFKENETEANVKYLSKIITVTGKVLSQKTEDGKAIVQIETSDPMGTILCNLDPFAKQTKTTFEIGEEVSFKGTCSGYLSDVILDRCIESKK